MIDLSKTIEGKSNCLVADDLMAGEKTITITNVSLNNTERPVVIDYIGGEGKSYMPSLTMRRALTSVWGKNGQDYIGKSLTLYRDNLIKFGGQEGGICISHVTGINKPVHLSLTISRGKKRVFTINPLIMATPTPEKPKEEIFEEISQALSVDDLKNIYSKYKNHSKIEAIKDECSARKDFLLLPAKEQEIINQGDNNVITE